MFKTTTGTYRQLLSGDPDFSFSPDGIKIVPRAGFMISSGCPYTYKEIIEECVRQGWLKPVANMRDEEYTWEKLQS